MSNAEEAAERGNIFDQFRANPAAFVNGMPTERAYAEIIRHGSAYEREQLVWKLRADSLAAPKTDAAALRWTAIMKRHLSFDATLATMGTARLTGQDMNDVLEIYSLMLETSLPPAERESLTVFTIKDFTRDPASFVHARPAVHDTVMSYMNDVTPLGRERRRAELWDVLLKNAAKDPDAKELVKLLTQDPSVVVVTDDAVIRQPQIDAFFASNDLVAELAHLPHSTDAEHAAMAKSLPARFGSLP
jgi:hypothetical protein